MSMKESKVTAKEAAYVSDSAAATRLEQVLAEVGLELKKDPYNTYPLLRATTEIQNLVYRDQKAGGHRYDHLFARYIADGKKERKDGTIAKEGEKKKVAFTSEFFCQKPLEEVEHLPVKQTPNGPIVLNKHICGKAANCPICGPKIYKRRGEEIEELKTAAKKKGASWLLVTLTASHGVCFLDSLERMQKAYMHLMNSGTWKKLKKSYNLAGVVKVIETKIGGSEGAHVHYHCVLFYDSSISEAEQTVIKKKIYEQWKKSCGKFGLKTNSSSVDLKSKFEISYITKQATAWHKEALDMSVDAVFKSHTPWGHVARMCVKANEGGYSSYKELYADCMLYLEYVCGMYGRTLIQFSRGLRAWAGLGESKKDEEIAREASAEAKPIGEFDLEQYNYIRSHYMWKEIRNGFSTNVEATVRKLDRIFTEQGMMPFRVERERYDGWFVESPAAPDGPMPDEVDWLIGQIEPGVYMQDDDWLLLAPALDEDDDWLIGLPEPDEPMAAA